MPGYESVLRSLNPGMRLPYLIKINIIHVRSHAILISILYRREDVIYMEVGDNLALLLH